MDSGITGSWTPADASKNHLEAARTDEGLIALRNSHTPGQVVYTTVNQLSSFFDSEKIRNLVNS